MHLSPKTIDNALAEWMALLGVHRRVALVARAHQLGLIDLSEIDVVTDG